MRFGSLVLRFMLVIGVSCLSCLHAVVASAQTMLAVYGDIEGGGDGDDTVYGYQSVYEDPYYAQFCYHYDNVFTTNLYSPSGRASYGGESASLPLEDEEGTWYVDVAYAATCPCAGSVSAGNSAAAETSIHISYYGGGHSPEGGGVCEYPIWGCSSGGLVTGTCGPPPVQSIVGPGGTCFPYIWRRFKRVNGRCTISGFDGNSTSPGVCT